MKLYTFDNKDYYLSDDVYKEEPITFIGCSKTTRLIVTKKNLKQEDYVYKKYIKSTSSWEESIETYRQAKLFISKDWVHNNLIKYKEDKTEEDLKLEAMIAPPILDLEDEEKFRDINGNILDIEIRGDRDIDDIYFKVKDISIKFELGDVTNTLLHSGSSFFLNLHYKTYKIINMDKIHIDTNKSNNKYLFLTFKGLTKLLYVSHSKNAEHFQDWANKILFTHQLGNHQEREELAASLVGINSRNVRDVFNLTDNTTPGVYLILCGLAKDILKDNNYSDSDIVCKFGCSSNITRRLYEHENKLNKEFNSKIEVLCYSIIDPKYIFDAENNLKIYFKPYKIDYKNKKELIVINQKDINNIKNYYSVIHDSYIGCYKELHNKITKLTDELKDKNIELDRERHKNELNEEKFNSKLKDKDLELKNKDIELLQYKIKLLELTNK